MFQELLINFVKFTNIIVYRIEFDNARWSDPRNSGCGSLVSGGLGWERGKGLGDCGGGAIR